MRHERRVERWSGGAREVRRAAAPYYAVRSSASLGGGSRASHQETVQMNVATRVGRRHDAKNGHWDGKGVGETSRLGRARPIGWKKLVRRHPTNNKSSDTLP